MSQQSDMEDILTTAIQHLKKVELEVMAGNVENTYNLTPVPLFFQFLLGIGVNGLEPFELSLLGQQSGFSQAMTIASGEAQSFFGRLSGPLRQLLGLHLFPEKLYLRLTVSSVHDAENREIVQALARMHGGCGGSCDCGCSSC